MNYINKLTIITNFVNFFHSVFLFFFFKSSHIHTPTYLLTCSKLARELEERGFIECSTPVLNFKIVAFAYAFSNRNE